MAKFTKHIFVSGNQRAWQLPLRMLRSRRGAADLQRAFKNQLALCGLQTTVRANKSGCLDQCEHGPTVVVYPEGIWYGNVQLSDVPEIVESHIAGDRPVERLRLAEGCINTGTCEHRSTMLD